MTVLVDTSAFFAFLDRDEVNNTRAVDTLERLITTERLVTHNYVATETAALVHRRLGSVATREFLEVLLPSTEILWVQRDTHQAATSAFLGALSRDASLVDWVTFEVMRRNGIRSAFCFDQHFTRQGFDTVP